MYVDDILLSCSDVSFAITDEEVIVLKAYKFTYLSEALLVQGIEVRWDISKGVLGLLQRAYLEKKSKET